MSERFDPYYTWLGIPPHEQPANHYRLLGISTFESNPEVISNAADRVMLHLRAFQAGQRSKESQQLLNEVASARVTLLEPEKKSAYDAELRVHQRAVPPAIEPSPNALPEPPPANLATASVPIEVNRQGASMTLRAPVRPAARRRKPTPRIVIVALVAAALVAIGGGIAFLLSRTSGLHSEISARPVWLLAVSTVESRHGMSLMCVSEGTIA
jgi:hypothetical protein